MEKNQPWTNHVVGETDGLHFAQKINLGIENSPGAQRFPFNNMEDFRFFG